MSTWPSRRCEGRGAPEPCGVRELILSVDQGTTGSRAFVFSADGRVVSQAYREFRQHYPRPGWVEHDPNEILNSVYRVVHDAVRSRAMWRRIAAIGITNQRETFVLWDARTGRPLHRAVVWQCRRSTDICGRLRSEGREREIRQRAGLVLDPYFSGTKVRWLIEHAIGIRDRVRKGDVCFGTIDTWLLWHFTGGAHATDFTNASRTMMFNIRSRTWDPELLEILRIPTQLRLPRVQASASSFGVTRRASGMPDGVPVLGIAGDQQAALFGQAATRPGEIKNTYGTGCFLMLHTGDRFVPSSKGLLTTMACDAKGQVAYALEGAVFITGALIQWLRDGLKILKTAAESETLAAAANNSHGVMIVPAFTGLGAPYWRPDVRGAIFGLTRGCGREHVARAALEAIAYQTRDVFDVMSEACARVKPAIRIREMRVDGGACRNNLLMQIQSDVLGVPLIRPRQTEATAWGAAKLAAVAAGLRTGDRDRTHHSVDKIFRPSAHQRQTQAGYDAWRSFVSRLL